MRVLKEFFAERCSVCVDTQLIHVISARKLSLFDFADDILLRDLSIPVGAIIGVEEDQKLKISLAEKNLNYAKGYQMGNVGYFIVNK